ncbi:hypothetical protein SNE_A00980 [Simkania negevensis Z]|uniref:DUF4340 domain-containing protein n=1 Tax=Simkania negevensis (strain ATCC VR-1471 / DSM 27360 / Z) TaxID=331113 RepID=F8L594_SIMNZ|nr:hypothetical protein SNE_A00980 [Simkania negevensis Z]
MIAKELTFVHIHKILKLLNSGVLLLFLGALVWLGLLLFQSNEENGSFSEKIPKTKTLDKTSVTYEKIGEGALKISSELKSFPLPDLKREMRFLGKNTRPDATIYDLLIHVGLKGSGQSLKVVSGQKLYLTYVEGEKPYLQFSSEPTPLWIMPHLSESGETLVELGVRLLTEGNEKLVEEKKTFEIEDLLQKEDPSKKDPLFQQAVGLLQKGHWWEPDRLFELYGGFEYQALKNHERIEFSYEEKPNVVHFRQGDTLVWKDGKWSRVFVGKETRKAPIAQAKMVTPQKIEWELWSSDGLEKASVTHEKERAQALNFRIEEVFSRVRQRTASRISCRIGNKATILKAGDWILHTPSGWRVLKSLREVEEVLTFQTRGELFVFDGIEKKEGKAVFSGALFDPMRTQVQNVKIPIAMQNKQEHSPHKKKVISTKIRSSSEEVSQEEPSLTNEMRRRPRKKPVSSPEGF